MMDQLLNQERDRERGTGNREPGTEKGERMSRNECTTVIPIRIQNMLFNAT